jgi:hypothetical protein
VSALATIPWFFTADQAAYKAGLQIKLAADPSPAYNLTGLLYLSMQKDKPWMLLSVPAALVRGVFDAMHEPGAELPLDEDGKLNAHISVIRPDEVALVGGANAFKNDRGKPFRYTIGRLMEVEPEGWPEMKKVYYLTVHSPELQELRRSHALSSLPNEGKFALHVTCAVVRKGVLGRNDTAKGTAPA